MKRKTKKRESSYKLASAWIDRLAYGGDQLNWNHQQIARSLAAVLRKYAGAQEGSKRV